MQRTYASSRGKHCLEISRLQGPTQPGAGWRAWPLRALALLAMAALSGCGLFDSGVQWRGGHYALVWIDTPENTAVYREAAHGHLLGRIDASVYALGWDGRYLVAKQHPGGDKSKVNWFVMDAAADSDWADSQKSLAGPLDEAEYRIMAKRLKLPEFSVTLQSLE